MLDMSSSMPIFHDAVGDLVLGLCSDCAREQQRGAGRDGS
jgi:hypothetical protein